MSPPPPPPADAPPEQKRKVNEALVYLNAVKDKVQDKRDKYEEFKQVLCDFNRGRIDTDSMIARVKTLFSGHPKLILGFKAFLPKEYENKLQDLEMEKKHKHTKSVNCVQKMKSQFQPVDHIYKSFLGILFQYYKSTQDACEEVATLLHDHPDLITEFRNYFLPDTSTAPQVVTVPTGVSVEHDNRNPIMASFRNVQSIPSSPTHMSLPPPPPLVAPSGQKPTTIDALIYLKAVKDKCQEKRDKYEEFKQVLCDFNRGRIDTYSVIIHVKTLFRGHPELILGFNAFLPKGYEIKLQDLEMKPSDFMKILLNKIKSQFQQEDHVYNSFLGILDMHNKSMQDAYVQVTTLFHDQPNLLDDFMHFLPGRSTALQAMTVPRGVSVRHGDRIPVMPSARNVQSIERERADPSTADCDISVDQPDLENDSQRRCIEKEKDYKVDQDRSDYVRDEKDGEHDSKDSNRGQRKHEPFVKMMERTYAETIHQGGGGLPSLLHYTLLRMMH